jgi:hypothetical protein
MTVKELIEMFSTLPLNATVVTNECETTSAHEVVVQLDTIEVVSDDQVFIGTYDPRKIGM